ncbi:hypothetical protein GGI43DRAFT_428518 [Trichoderma evansii]
MADITSWHYLPAEIRTLILEALLQDGCNLASFVTVSREWQAIIEPHIFSRIKLTSSRVKEFGLMAYRNRALVRYIWLCLEFQEYGCAESSFDGLPLQGITDTDNNIIITTVYSPSDSEHWFKYLTFEPDISSREWNCGQLAEQSILAKISRHQHIWVPYDEFDGALSSTSEAIFKVFDEIMSEGPFETREHEAQWWLQLPLVPAITAVLLRQQTRRRWNPKALSLMFSRFPRLQEIHYEPWREWESAIQAETDHYNQIQRLTIFENFNQQYPQYYRDANPIRAPASYVGQAVANTSLKLECLSASFIVDASYFFQTREHSWRWPNLTLLILTYNCLFLEAAAAAMKMPNLKTMEIWNGREGLAALFRYQLKRDEQSAMITWRGTWDFTLQPAVIQAWEAVAHKYHGNGSIIIKELLDVNAIKCHGDAIYHLKLSELVIRPVSLRQIRIEHEAREEMLNRSQMATRFAQ